MTLVLPRGRRWLALLTLAILLAASVAEARPGRGGGFGSRGGRTFQAPPATQTAPRQAAPIDRSVTPQSGAAFSQAAPRAGAVGAARGPFGSRGGFLGGFLGAGLIGALLGYGLFGGLGGIGAILGLLLQVGLVVLVVGFVVRMFQRRSQPAYAGAGGPPLGGADTFRREDVRPGGAGLGGAAAPAPASRGDELGIRQADLDIFERVLGEVQTAYSREDEAALEALTTPEIAGYLKGEIADNAARHLRNEVRDVKLEQGDVAESWREGGTEYATVAMRFSFVDLMLDRGDGRVVEGDPERRTEATEIWTFRRDHGGDWKLSAQQTA